MPEYKPPYISGRRATAEEVRAAFGIKTPISPEERARNFVEASKLVNAYERYLEEGRRLSLRDLTLIFD